MRSPKIKTNLPLVSAIIPCRNEEKFISRCLDSIIATDYPKDKLEILVVDGMSQDMTREIVKDYASRYSYIKLLDNPQKTTPFAMNIGIKKARGEVIMKMDAHTVYQKDYISKCLKYLTEYQADNVGGVLEIIPGTNTLLAKAITLALSHRFGSGSSLIKTGSQKPSWTDSVAFGCFRKEVFEKIGLYDEKMTRSQDLELNLRLKRTGGKILLVPSIRGHYYADPNLKAFFRHNFIDGLWITYPLKFGKMVFSWRHLIPLLFVSLLIGLAIFTLFSPIFSWLLILILILYFLLNIFFSFKITKKEKEIRYLFLMPIVFASRHFGYGLGSIWGVLKAVIG